MRLIASVLVVAAACGSSPHVSTTRMGGMFPARPSDCSLEMHSGDLDGQMMLTHDVVGFVTIGGANAGEPPNSPRLLALLKPQACALGGEIVTVGLSANYTYPGTLQRDDSQHSYMVLRKKSASGPTVQTF
jgi:hypothetical protein